MAKAKDATPVYFKLGVGETFEIDTTLVTIMRVRKGIVSVQVKPLPPEVKKARG